MNRLTVVLSILLTLGLLLPISASAQHPQHHAKRGMMAPDSMSGPMMGMMEGVMMGQGMIRMMHGMHQRMMQNPMHRSNMMIFMLPTLADTLGLSDQQAEQVNKLKSEAMTQRSEHREQLMAQRRELMGLFEGDEHPAPEAVRRHLTTMAEMRASQQASMYETAHRMRQVLTDEQRQMLDGLTPQQMMRQMMSRMPMMDMMQMMRSMHGGGMMSGKMMQGMMQHQSMMRGMHPRRMQQDRQNQ
jgi:hypothetical protein